MKKSLLTALCLVVGFGTLGALAMGRSTGMSANQQEKCRQACQMRGDKWDPTSADNRKGCTCVNGDGEGYTITDSDRDQTQLDNTVNKTRQ